MPDKDDRLIFEAYDRPDVPEFDAAAENPDAIAMFHKTLIEVGLVRDEDFEARVFNNEPGHKAYTIEGPPQKIMGHKPRIVVGVLRIEDKRPNVDRPEFDKWEDSRPGMKLADAIDRLVNLGANYIKYVQEHPEYLHGIGFRVMVSIMTPDNPYSPSFPPDEETGLLAHSTEMYEKDVNDADDVIDILLYIKKAAEYMAAGPYQGKELKPIGPSSDEPGVFDK